VCSHKMLKHPHSLVFCVLVICCSPQLVTAAVEAVFIRNVYNPSIKDFCSMKIVSAPQLCNEYWLLNSAIDVKK
jgi:hypothetical protein